MLKLVFCFSLLMCMVLSSHAQTCSRYAFSGNRLFRSCSDLPVLNSFIHYNYDSSSQELQIAYRHTGVSSSQWVAWAINPTGQGMVGSQALVAYQQDDGKVRAYTSPITQYKTSLQEGDLSFKVSDLAATYARNEMIIYATLGLKNTSTDLHQVWQTGPLSGGAPQIHNLNGPNVKSMGTLSLVSGLVGTAAGGQANSKAKKRNIHGLLNAVSWGLLMPLGAIFARHLKVFKSSTGSVWFYLHVACQFSAYVIGVAGWATGLKLGSESPGITYSTHRNIGTVLFCFGTIQAFALLLRPKPDHKYRTYWNVYHHTLGYAIIILGVINVFKGLAILHPANQWKLAYSGSIIALACIFVLMEAYTWFVVIKRKQSEKGEKLSNGAANGYSSRQGV